MAVVKEVEKDKFGVERFAELKKEFAKFKLNKDFQRRYDRIDTVFCYRRDVAYELHRLEENREYDWVLGRKCEETKTRLATFKPVQFFLDALKALLDEVRQDSMKFVKKK